MPKRPNRKQRNPPVNPIKGRRGFLETTTALLTSAKALCVCFSGLAAVAGTILGVMSPPDKLPESCTDQIIALERMSDVQAANEIFWKAHPGLERRLILLHEKEFSEEWWGYQNDIQACRKALQESQNRP